MRPISRFIISVALIYIPQAPLSARDCRLGDCLLGDWNGARLRQIESGVTPDMVYTVDYAKPVGGGDDNSPVFMANLDLTLDIDLEKRFGWQGGELFFYALGNHSHVSGNGEFLGDKLRNAQAASNIEAPTAAKIYEFWYDQTFLDTWSARIGLYDLNSEFDVIESAGGLINSSFGIGADYAQSGENGPSIFPATSLALRLRYVASSGLYAQAAIFDGVPGDPDNEHGTHVQLGGGDGVLQSFEAGMVRAASITQAYRKFAVGAWRYNPEQQYIDSIQNADSGTAPRTTNNQGYYLLGEYQVLQEDTDPQQGTAVFFRYGEADADINAIEAFTGFGLSCIGMLSGRDQDQLSMGVAIAHFSDAYIDAVRGAGNTADRQEIVYEISYRLQIAPWLAVQPDLQFISAPAGVADADNVMLALLRTEIVF